MRSRNRAHAALDALWKSGMMSRRQAYRWLQLRMQLTKDEAHIRHFDVARSEQVVSLVRTSLVGLAASMLDADLLSPNAPEPRRRIGPRPKRTPPSFLEEVAATRTEPSCEERPRSSSDLDPEMRQCLLAASHTGDHANGRRTWPRD